MPERDKGYQRGGASGMEGELGDDTVDMNRSEQGQADLPSDRSPSKKPLGESGLDQGAQRGGLRREPNLEGAEERTGHEVD